MTHDEQFNESCDMKARDADVLIVEDQPYDAELTMRAVQEVTADLTAAVVTTGRGAIEYLVTHRPKAILVMKLPDLDGLQVLKIVRSDPRTHSLPRIHPNRRAY